MKKTRGEEVAEQLAMFTDQRIPGGCDECDAYQELVQVEPLVFVMTVRHDDDCPVLAAYRAAS